MASVKYTDLETDEETSFYMEPTLLANLEQIKTKLTRDEDYVLAIDGREGSGKSVFGMQVAKAIDPTLSLDRICMNAQQFKDAIYKAQKGQAIIFDEAFSGLSSRGSMSEINRMLVSLMMQMRQKNLFVVVILPTFFMLDRYVAIFRSRGLIHIHKVKDKRYFMVFNHKKKKKLYLEGKQLFSFGKNRTRFTGRFYGKYVINENEYRKKKAKALEEMEKNPEDIKITHQRDVAMYWDKKNNKKSAKVMSEQYKIHNWDITKGRINQICARMDKLVGS